MGKKSFWASDYGLPSFVAARPLTSGGLARAKLATGAVTALATWILILAASPVWVILSGNGSAVRQLFELLTVNLETWELAVVLPTALLGLVGLTWLQVMGGMCLSLTGRPAIANSFALLLVGLSGLAIGLSVYTVSHPEFLDTVIIVLWWLGGIFGLGKFGLACWMVCRPGWRDRIVPGLLPVWLIVTGCLVAAVYVLVPKNPVPMHLVALLLLVAIPLTRPAALPAAIAWNRHR
jgi:hypothetical protein